MACPGKQPDIVRPHPLALAALLSILTLSTPSAGAETVHTQLGSLSLVGEMTKAGSASADRPTVLLLHDTLSHSGSAEIAKLSAGLTAGGWSVLAPNLSLGLSDRTGAFDCTQPHTHRHDDAVAEIDAWVDWLGARDVKRIVLAGSGRGANQIGWHAIDRPRAEVAGLEMLAPITWDLDTAADDYLETHGTHLIPFLGKVMKRFMDGEEDLPLEKAGVLQCLNASVQVKSFFGY